MKVSVIIPAYNEEQYIAQTLDAVLAQSHPDVEIIVVDNNSTDQTQERAKMFPTVQLVRETTPGVQHARERGRSVASGEIIANLDADCLPPPDWIKGALKHFDDPEVVAVSGPCDYYDAPKYFRVGSTLLQKLCFNPLHRLAHFFRKGVFMMGGNVLIRADALEKIGGYNTAIAFYGDDTDTANRLLSVGKVLYRNNVSIQTSARRFQRMGAMNAFGTYMINFIWVIIFKKSYH